MEKLPESDSSHHEDGEAATAKTKMIRVIEKTHQSCPTQNDKTQMEAATKNQSHWEWGEENLS